MGKALNVTSCERYCARYVQNAQTEAILRCAESFIAGTTPTVLFLASEGVNNIMGQLIPIDGGRSAQ